MTSTNIHIGLSENSRSSSKVLKPPGGGSSDIFGHGNGNSAATPRSNKGHMASNIFAAPLAKTCNDRQGEYRYFFIGDNHRRNPNMDSHNRLFGEVERPYTPAKNHQKSSIPFGGDSVDATPRTNGTNGKANGTNGHTNGNGHSNGGEAMVANGNSVKHDGNPVTGQGYTTEINTAVPALNGGSKPAFNGTNQVINKNRIPPGGFSSGLW